MEISFNADYAKNYGLNEAILMSVLDTLIEEEGIECEGSKWIVISYERLGELLPFMSCTTIRRTVYNLEKQGIVKTKTSKSRKWYALNISVQNGQGNSDKDAENSYIKPAQNEQEQNPEVNLTQSGYPDSAKDLAQNEQGRINCQTEHPNPIQTGHAQNGQPEKTAEIRAFLQPVQNGHPNNNNCRNIIYYDKDNLKPDQENFIHETTTNIDNLDQEQAVQNRLPLKEIKNLLAGYDIEISWNKRAWQALKQLAALTRDEILKLAKRLFSLQCEGVIKNPAGLLVAKPAEIIRAFFTGTLYPSHTAEYERSEYFPLYVYAS